MTPGQLIFSFIILFLSGKEILPETGSRNLHEKFPHTASTGIIDIATVQDSVSSVIPFSRAGNLILVQGRADTTQGNFILDTGAPGLVLNRTYFRDYPATAVPESEQGGVSGGTQSHLRTTVNQFTLGDLRYSRLEADLADLGHIENTKGVRILGLVGMELLNNCEMIIDYDNSLIYLHRFGKGPAAGYQHELLRETSAYTTYPIEIRNHRVIVTTELAGKKLKLVVDSGAESNVLDSRLPDRIFENVVITRRVMIAGTGNTKLEALYGDVQHMKLGGSEMASLPFLITNLEKSCFSYAGCVDGILGFDFLSLHRIGFNFVKRKMYIWK